MVNPKPIKAAFLKGVDRVKNCKYTKKCFVLVY